MHPHSKFKKIKISRIIKIATDQFFINQFRIAKLKKFSTRLISNNHLKLFKIYFKFLANYIENCAN